MNKFISNMVMPLRKYPIAGISMLLFVIMALFVPKFFTSINLASFGAQLSYIGIGATGLAFILIGGGMDISTGTTMSLSGILSGLVMVKITSGWSDGWPATCRSGRSDTPPTSRCDRSPTCPGRRRNSGSRSPPLTSFSW